MPHCESMLAHCAVPGRQARRHIDPFEDFADDDEPSSPARRSRSGVPATERLAYDLDAGLLVVVLHAQLLQDLGGAHRSNSQNATACRRCRLALLTVSRRMRRHDWAQRTKRMSLRL